MYGKVYIAVHVNIHKFAGYRNNLHSIQHAQKNGLTILEFALQFVTFQIIANEMFYFLAIQVGAAVGWSNFDFSYVNSAREVTNFT